MRQVISLVKDGHVHYGVVDDDAGELIPFAEILLPNPDRFGLHEAAVLGTNLISAIGLNGRPPKLRHPDSPPALPVAPEAAPAAEETSAERKRRKDREYWTRRQAAKKSGTPPPHQQREYTAVTRQGTPRQRALPDPENRVQRRIEGAEVWAIINQHPEGLTARQISEYLWASWGETGEVPRWVTRTVENRLASADTRWRDKRIPRPFRAEVQTRGTTGRGGSLTKLIYPAVALPTALQPPNPMATNE